MDNSLLIAMQTQRVLQRRLDSAANNLANATTAGFKADRVVLNPFAERPAQSENRPNDVRFVRDVATIHDFTQGPIATTGSAFDVAIEGEGFFAIEGPGGAAHYTRDGSFRLGADNRLVTRDGYAVLGEGGAPIVFDPRGESPTIDQNGVIRIAGAAAGRLQLVAFDDPQLLEKSGDNLFTLGEAQEAPFDGVIVQGALEGSNVSPVLELTRVLEISRAYESAARMVRQGDELRQRAIDRLGRT